MDQVNTFQDANIGEVYIKIIYWDPNSISGNSFKDSSNGGKVPEDTVRGKSYESSVGYWGRSLKVQTKEAIPTVG